MEMASGVEMMDFVHNTTWEGCFHCGQALPRTVFSGNIGGAEKSFCCAGCMAVCRHIFDSGLEGYYEKRDNSRPAAPPAINSVVFNDVAEGDPRFVTTEGNRAVASLLIGGIHCAACVWLLERVTGKMDGVISSRVNFSTQRMSVEWDKEKTALRDIVFKIASIGYTAAPYDSSGEELLAQKENALFIKAAVAGFGFLVTMFLSEGLYGGYIRGIERGYRDFLQWASMIVSLPVVVYSGAPFVFGAWRGLKNRLMTMDLPVALGLLITYLYSAWATFIGRGDVYFDSATMFVFLILTGRFLEAKARKKAFSAVARLKSMEPQSATVVSNGVRVKVRIKSVKEGDLVEVRPGGKVPLDGVIVEGGANVDESMLTGEANPVSKNAGDKVYAATTNTDGSFVFRVTGTGDKTLLSGIKKLVEEAQLNKAGAQKTADRIAAWFVPVILAAAALTFIYWSVFDPANAMIYSVAVLIITCPCALALATPAAILAASGAAARDGIIVKSASALERLNKATHVVLDKTGTLTEGKMTVVGLKAAEGVNENNMLALAASVERFSEHPVGKAVCAEAKKRALDPDALMDGFKAYPGKGVEAFRVARPSLSGGPVAGADYKNAFLRQAIIVGNRRFLEEKGVAIPSALLESERRLSSAGNTVAFVAAHVDGPALKAMGIIAVTDPPRQEAAALVRELKAAGLKITMLTGDNRKAAESLAKRLYIDNVIAGALPAEKEEVVRGMRKDGDVVVMAGDGINDGPALAGADVGMAIGSGADLAIASADIVILNGNPLMIARAIGVSKKSFGVIRGNLALSFVYNAVFMPLAAMGFIVPLVAAIAMPLSSLLVIGNSIRAGRR